MALNHHRNVRTSFMGVAYRPLELLSNAKIAVYADGNTTTKTWTEDGGVVETPVDPVWVGWASFTPNIDWRARNREWAGEITGVHAYRIQLLHIDRNELRPREQWGDPSLRVRFREGMRVVVKELVADPSAVGMRLIVRNAQTDALFWQQTLLCDTETSNV